MGWINTIPWLAAIGVLLLVPLLFAFDMSSLLSLLTSTAFLIVLGLELQRAATRTSRGGSTRSSQELGWLHAGWMGVVWTVYQLIELVGELGMLVPYRDILSLVVIGLAAQYFAMQFFGQQAVVRLPNLGVIGTLSTPLLMLAAIMFITLIGNASLVTGAIFLTAAGHLINDENAYARYLVPLGTLLVGYSVII